MSDQQEIDILLVEDEPTQAQVVRLVVETITTMRLRMDHAASLAEAAARLGVHQPPVILLDLNLPDSRSVHTFEAVRRLAPKSQIIVVTGIDDPAVASACLVGGAHRFLTRSLFTRKALVDAIASAAVAHARQDVARIGKAEGGG